MKQIQNKCRSSRRRGSDFRSVNVNRSTGMWIRRKKPLDEAEIDCPPAEERPDTSHLDEEESSQMEDIETHTSPEGSFIVDPPLSRTGTKV